MKKKSRLAICTACILLTGALMVPALAHGSHHGSRHHAAAQPCAVEDCRSTGTHQHSGVTYCGHAQTEAHGHHGC